MEKLIIDRSKWNTGYRLENESFLLSSNGNMCCLGFLARQCGASDSQMRLEAYPNHVRLFNWPENVNALFENSNYRLTVKDSYYSWQEVFTILNDIKNIKHEVRESWIKTGFKILFGYDVEFIGDY